MLKLRRYFFTGLAVLLPISLTCYIIFIVFSFAEQLVGKYINNYLLATFKFFIPGLGLILTVAIIIIVGFLSAHLLGKRVFPFFEKILLRIPFIRQVYTPSKKIVEFFFKGNKQLFRQVVLVEYPRKGVWSVGFVTNEGMPQASKALGKDTLNVFIPSTPGPLTGYLIFVAKEEVIFLDITTEDALKVIVSGGVINPG